MTPEPETTIGTTVEVEYIPAWMTWVGSVTSCLNALGVKCDLADVAGASGYAFAMSIHEALCPSGPTVVPVDSFRVGINLMGRGTVTFHPNDGYGVETEVSDRMQAHFRYAYELVARETSEGRPCVMWGVDVPEYCVVYGVDKDNFLVKSYRPHLGKDDTPIPFDKPAAPGGPYILAFPTETWPEGSHMYDRHAIYHAMQLLTGRSEYKNYGWGLKAYENWIAAFEAGPGNPPNNEHTPFGNAYNVQCWNEMKWCAKDFLPRVAARREFVRKSIEVAALEYEKVYQATHELASIFKFPPGDEFMDEGTRAMGIGLLKDAWFAETQACKALIDACEVDWESYR